MYTPPPDKVLHFAAGAILALAGLAAVAVAQSQGLFRPRNTLILPLLVCVAAAIGREVYNKRQGGEFSVADIGATLAGGGVVLWAALLAMWAARP